MEPIEISKLHEAFEYDAMRGVLVWRYRPDQNKSWNTRFAGKDAGSKMSLGYILVALMGQRLYAHRIIIAMTNGSWPQDHTDHINGDRSDNRIDNLRCVTQAENNKNRAAKANATGFPGVRVMKKKYQARVTIRPGHILHLGCFDTPEMAHDAYVMALSENGYHANHGRAA